MFHSSHKQKNTLEIIRPFATEASLRGDVQIMGGVGMAALLHENVAINEEQKTVWVPDDLFLASEREDGTKRDIDVLVLSSDDDQVHAVDASLALHIGDALERSVFGIRPNQALLEQYAKPLGGRALRTFLSDRYEAEAVQTGQYVKSLTPFSAPIEEGFLDTWGLYIGQNESPIPIPHPGAAIANYTNRSISGVRPRDAAKIHTATDTVLAKAPFIEEWLREGPGQSQIELGKLIASLRLRGEKDLQISDSFSLATYAPEELREHDYFTAKNERLCVQRKALCVAAIKSVALHLFENNQGVVKFWRQYGESRTQSIVKNL